MSSLLRLGRRFRGLSLRLGAAAFLAVFLYAVLLGVLALEAIATGKEAK